LVFRPGKLVITGARFAETAKKQFMKVYPLLAKFAVDPSGYSNYDKGPFAKPTNQLNQLVNDFIENLMLEKLVLENKTIDNEFPDEGCSSEDEDEQEMETQIAKDNVKRRKIQEENDRVLRFPTYEIFVKTLEDKMSIILNDELPESSLQPLKLVKNKIEEGLILKLAELLGREQTIGSIERCIQEAWEPLYIGCGTVETISLTCLQDEISKMLFRELKSIGSE